MTINELLTSEKPLLTASEAGSILGMHTQTLNLKAKMNDLPFPFIRSGNRTKIPRRGLIEFLRLEDKRQ